jgi:RHS repeat-associated protein
MTSDKKYLWDGVDIAEERDTTGAIVLRRFYNQGFVDSDGTALFYTRDHLGSIRELTDGTQAIRARYDYDPYGRMTKIQGDRDSAFGFTGDFWHAQSGLDLTLYRAYDPNLGRWLSRDPIGEDGGKNLYAYVDNDPVGLIDPFGLAWWNPFSWPFPWSKPKPGSCGKGAPSKSAPRKRPTLPPLSPGEGRKPNGDPIFPELKPGRGEPNYNSYDSLPALNLLAAISNRFIGGSS